MKKIFLSVVLSVLTLFAFSSTPPHIITSSVNVESSTIKWVGSKVASSHEGNVSIIKGALSIDHGTLVGGDFAIDMNSITCTDIKSEKKNNYLVEHLKDEDFFNTKSFPIAEIKIVNAIKQDKEGVYTIIADLTIKGITHPVSFVSNVLIDGKNFEADAKIEIDRTKWDIRYGSGSFFEDLGDKMILDTIVFDVFLTSQER